MKACDNRGGIGISPIFEVMFKINGNAAQKHGALEKRMNTFLRRTKRKEERTKHTTCLNSYCYETEE
jgi:hypothetical protein